MKSVEILSKLEGSQDFHKAHWTRLDYCHCETSRDYTNTITPLPHNPHRILSYSDRTFPEYEQPNYPSVVLSK